MSPMPFDTFSGLAGFGTGLFQGIAKAQDRKYDLAAELEKERRKEQQRKYLQVMDIMQQTTPEFNPSELEMGAQQGSMPYSDRQGAMSQVANYGTLGSSPNVPELPGAPLETERREKNLKAQLGWADLKSEPKTGDTSAPATYGKGIPKEFKSSPELTGEYVLSESERRSPGSTRGGAGKVDSAYDPEPVKKLIDAIKAGKNVVNNSIEGLSPAEKQNIFSTRISQLTKGGQTLSIDGVNAVSIASGLGLKYSPDGKKLW